MIDWKESFGLAKQFMKVEPAKGIVNGGEHCYKRTIRGNLKNEDILV